MRKLASVRKIDEINPIEGADAIEVATIGGWKVVVKKNEFKVGDLAVYLEIDSWVPTELAPFLSKGKEPREYFDVKGERLRTVKLRGQLSQGLLLPYAVLPFGEQGVLVDGDDVSEILGIQKWEAPVNAQLAGLVKGNFPSLIPKTDQERVQNLKKEIEGCFEKRARFEITEKLEGSSMTCYVIDGVFGVCSRNLDLKRDENNSFWKVAIEQGIEEKLLAVRADIAIQGELIGPGVQGNIYNLPALDYFVFDVYKIQFGGYMDPAERREFVEGIGLKHVPVIAHTADMFDTLGLESIDHILKFAEGKSTFNPRQEREGIVFKEVNGGITFKAISNKYLLGEK